MESADFTACPEAQALTHPALVILFPLLIHFCPHYLGQAWLGSIHTPQHSEDVSVPDSGAGISSPELLHHHVHTNLVGPGSARRGTGKQVVRDALGAFLDENLQKAFILLPTWN